MALRGGRYEILGTIASGGMATVHLGRALGAGGFERLVALKTMHKHLASEAEFVAMFLDEARLAARIRHPNVVGTLDIQSDAEGLFLVMEYVEGPSLSRVLKALGRDGARLPIDIALRIFTDTLAGLHAAHELTGPAGDPLRLIHRDMSPHNVLVGVDGVVRITDFGIARAESRLASTRTGSIKGKTMYMAPEQVRSEAMDRRTDLYAAGALLWEMLTGQRLVRADSEIAMMHQIIEAERKTPHDVNPAIPPELSAVCMRALERNRELRFPTAMAFSEALDRATSAAGLVPATPRAVGQYVRALGVHVTPADLPAAPVSSSMPDPTPAPPSVTATPSAGSDARQALTAVETAAPSTGTRASFATPVPAPPPSEGARTGRGAKGIVVAAAAILVVALGVLWLALGRTGPKGPDGSLAASALPSGDSSAPATPGASATSGAANTVSAADTVSAPGTGSAANTVSAPGTGSAANTVSAPGAASATAAASASVNAPAGRPAGPHNNSKSFRPREL